MNQLRLHAAAALSLLLFAIVLTGCMGGGDDSESAAPAPQSTTSSDSASEASSSVPKQAVAVVGSQEIAMSDFERLMQRTQATYRAQGRQLPKPGSDAEQTLKTSIVQFLVERVQLEKKAAELGIHVTGEDVDRRLDELTQTRYGGSETKLEQALAKEHLTVDDLKGELRAQLVQERLYARVTRDVKVTAAEVRGYYDSHKDQFRASGTLSPFAAVEQQIRQQLLQEKKNEKMGEWVGAVTRELRLQTTYQQGFMPAGQRATIKTTP
jgi:hypothetical protein